MKKVGSVHRTLSDFGDLQPSTGTCWAVLRTAVYTYVPGTKFTKAGSVSTTEQLCTPIAITSLVKMFDLAWYLEWEEGEGAPTWGKMWVFIDNPRLCSLFTV
eukprot:SAG31_NODE_1567_length_7859_cov_18.238531_2_plen_102_part_00